MLPIPTKWNSSDLDAATTTALGRLADISPGGAFHNQSWLQALFWTTLQDANSWAQKNHGYSDIFISDYLEVRKHTLETLLTGFKLEWWAAYFFSALEIITSPTPTSMHTTITNEHRSLQICWLEWFQLWGRLLTSFSAPRCIRFSSVLVFRSMLTSKLNAWGSAQNGNEWERRLQKEGKGRLQQNLLETKGKRAKLRESALHGQEM